MQRAGIDAEARAETMTLAQFDALAQRVILRADDAASASPRMKTGQGTNGAGRA
jgi:hypothetical protein